MARSWLSVVPVLGLAALSIASAVQVGCLGKVADDGTREDSLYGPDYGYGYTSPGSASCKPASNVLVVEAPEPPPSCAVVCASHGMKCNDQGFAGVASTPLPTYPYATDPTCHYAGRRVDYSCPSCYSGSAFATCDGAAVWSTTNYKSGPYTGTYCACSP
jgi:hypothetical protein